VQAEDQVLSDWLLRFLYAALAFDRKVAFVFYQVWLFGQCLVWIVKRLEPSRYFPHRLVLLDPFFNGFFQLAADQREGLNYFDVFVLLLFFKLILEAVQDLWKLRRANCFSCTAAWRLGVEPQDSLADFRIKINLCMRLLSPWLSGRDLIKWSRATLGVLGIHWQLTTKLIQPLVTLNHESIVVDLIDSLAKCALLLNLHLLVCVFCFRPGEDLLVVNLGGLRQFLSHRLRPAHSPLHQHMLDLSILARFGLLVAGDIRLLIPCFLHLRG